MTVSDWLDFAATKIPRSEARQLLEAILELAREELLGASRQDLENEHAAEADLRLNRRQEGEPLAYVVGKKQFFGREFVVNKEVLIPRPETELLVEAVREVIQPAWTCVDVGTGSGCIAATLAIEGNSRWVATDTSPDALLVAKLNAKHLNADIRLLQGDLLGAFQGNSIDLVVSNPPYIADGDPRVEPSVREWEPSCALHAGPTGLEAIRRLIDQAKHVLRPTGWLAFEFGMGQANDVRVLLKDWQIAINRDLAGIERYVLAQPTR